MRKKNTLTEGVRRQVMAPVILTLICAILIQAGLACTLSGPKPAATLSTTPTSTITPTSTTTPPREMDKFWSSAPTPLPEITFPPLIEDQAIIDQAEELYQQGREAYNAKDSQVAIEALNAALGLNPRHASAYLYRGKAYLSQGSQNYLSTYLENIDLAVMDFTRSIALDPSQWQPYYARGYCYHGRAQVEPLRENRKLWQELAMNDLNRALELDEWQGRARAERVSIYLETGKKRTVAGAVEWPGWCRVRSDEHSALQALVDYGPRYARVLRPAGIEFQAPADRSAFVVTERLVGNATTDFGAPAIMLEADQEAVDPAEYGRMRALLLACWQTLDRAAQSAADKTLRKGPRGGGRDTGQIVQHVLTAEQAYLGRIGWKLKSEDGQNLEVELQNTQQAALSALEASVKGKLPKQGPRGGVIWPVRYYIRRAAWHILDHAWEIEDRME